MGHFDTVVIGAGPAGLTAGVYLARFRRSVLLLDGGRPRASWIPESHNTPGFPDGVTGAALLARLTQQALEFGVSIRSARVGGVHQSKNLFEVLVSDGAISAQTVLLATGVVDRMPAIVGLEGAIRRSLVRMCPICDAYEAIGKRVAIFGSGGLAERERAFLQTYSDKVTVINDDAGRIGFEEHVVRWVTADGANLTFDHLYLALGCEPQSALARACGARTDDAGNLMVDDHQMTSIPGLFAAGDVVRGLNQIAVATGEAAVAATAIHNRLRGM